MEVNCTNFSKVISGLNLTNMQMYLRAFAPLGYYPSGHAIDYNSLGLLDDVRKFIDNLSSNRFETINRLSSNKYQLALGLFCLAYKNIENDKKCLKYALLAYLTATLGVNSGSNPLRFRALRLHIMMFISKDIFNSLEVMQNQNLISHSYEDAMSYIMMSDYYSAHSLITNERWYSEITDMVNDNRTDYPSLTNEQIIVFGDIVHNQLNTYFLPIANR